MLVFGYELQDVLRVVVGIALGLLTVYRRELSCNRGYHPEGDENDDPLGDSEHNERLLRSGRAQNASSLHEDDSPPRGLRRRNSSSALSSPGMISSLREHGDSVDSSTSKEDPTDELLESAGLILSGGPFLAMAIAVFDHLVLTIFLGTFASVSSLVHSIRVDPRNAATREDNNAVQPQTEGSTDQNETAEEQKYVYSVAWNAATEYFTGISSKLDGGSSIICSPGQGDEAIVRRSQSTGNLLHLSDERSRELLSEMIAMAGRGSMDVTLLPSDAQIAIFSYLYPQDVLAFTCTNRAGRQLLDDADNICGETAEEEKNNHIHDNNGVTALLVWKALFQRDYRWVLSSWEIGLEAFLRSVDDYGGRESQQPQLQHQRQTAASRVVRHVASTVVDSQKANDLDIDSVLEALSSSTIHPSSMKEFYFTFTETWLNYTIAGCNSTDKCLIGLHGHVFEISDFVEDHPGSTETLLLQAGRDATVFFESMGHSLGARKLAVKMVAVVNAQCARWHFTGEEGSSSSGFELRHGAFGPLFSTWGLIQPSCKSLDRKRNIVGFLTPRKRSRPRFQGGLHRIRERMRREEESQQLHAQRWESSVLGASGLFGGVHVYFDPFRGWRWWYTDRSFNTIFIAPQV